jgi:hypothetical protein
LTPHTKPWSPREVFEGIAKQLEANKSGLRCEHWWKRLERRRELKLPAARNGAGKDGDEEFFALVEPHLDKLREMAGWAIRYGEARGDLPRNEPELDEVVDTALLRAYDRIAKSHSNEDTRSRLIGFALAEIKAVVKRATKDRTSRMKTSKWRTSFPISTFPLRSRSSKAKS